MTPEETMEQQKNTAVEMPGPVKDINIYPAIRTILLVICVIVAVAIVFLLIYQNGKSIYDNGL